MDPDACLHWRNVGWRAHREPWQIGAFTQRVSRRAHLWRVATPYGAKFHDAGRRAAQAISADLIDVPGERDFNRSEMKRDLRALAEAGLTASCSWTCPTSAMSTHPLSPITVLK